MNPIEEHEERGKQRRAFLCEIYKRTEGNTSKAVPYEEVANSLNFEDSVMSQIYYYFLHDEYIFEIPPMVVGVIPPESRSSGNINTVYGRCIAITQKGIEMAKQLCP